MRGRIREVSGRLVRLSEGMLARVEHLAKLANVTTSDVVNYVLTEVFEGEDRPQPEAAVPELPRPAPPRRQPRGPADVIPITRNRCPVAPSPRSIQLMFGDLDYLRLQAADSRKLARRARAYAADVCERASRARHRAQDALDCARAYQTG
jgi:hypothetical protein